MGNVILSPVRRSDAAELIRANAESRDYHAPWVQPFTDAAGFERWFGPLGGGVQVSLVAREPTANGIVGVLNISQIVLGVFRSAYVGFYGSARYARQGLMTAALRQSVAYAFTEIGLHRLEANIQPENSASIALVRRAGFRREGFSPRYLQIGGVWRDHERWAVLADDGAARMNPAG
jgi:ribosomal-protein-alanine N-acetyltransferase